MIIELSAMVIDKCASYKEDIDKVIEIIQQIGDEPYNDHAFCNLYHPASR